MARVIGQAGRGALTEAIVGASEPLLYGAALAIAALIAIPVIKGIAGLIVFLVGIAIDGVLFRRTFYQAIQHGFGSRAWWRGYEGEKRTGEELAKLPDEYVIFNDYAFRSGDDWHDWNLDHIVVGPTGVFVLETKNSRRTRIASARIDVRTDKAVNQVTHNAMDLKDRLKAWSRGDLENVFVEGCVVYAQDGAHVEQLREKWTCVLPLRLLRKHITSRGKRDIDDEQRYRIVRTLFTQTYPERQERFKDVMRVIEEEHQHAVARRLAKCGAPQLVKETCPRCGADLVKKTAHKGLPDEHEFMSCKDWKNCGYGYDLPRAELASS